MATPVWRQILEGSYDPFSSSFNTRRPGGGGMDLSVDWRQFSAEQDERREQERAQAEAERAALELQGDEYVNLQQSQGRLERALGTAEALGQPNIEPNEPPTALQAIARILDTPKSVVVGALTGLFGVDIMPEDDGDPTKTLGGRFRREQDLIGNRSRIQAAWDRAMNALFYDRSYGFGDFGPLRYESDETSRGARTALGAAAFILDTAFDPLTYMSFGSSIVGRLTASTGVRVATRAAGAEALKSAGQEVLIREAAKLSRSELASRLVRETGEEMSDVIIRSNDDLVQQLLQRNRAAFEEAALDGWSMGNAAAYGARGRTGMFDRMVETVGEEAAQRILRELPGDLGGGLRIRVPFKRTVDEATGLRMPTIYRFPFSQPGRGFDRLGMGTVVRKMNEARLWARTNPARFIENVSGKYGKDWTKVLNAARRGDAEAVEAYSSFFGILTYDKNSRIFMRRYESSIVDGMYRIRSLLRLPEVTDQDEVMEWVRDAYFKRGRDDVPEIMTPNHVIASDIVNQLWNMTDNAQNIAVEVYGDEAAKKLENYATRMLSDEGFNEIEARLGVMKTRGKRMVEGGPVRDYTSFPKKIEMDDQGRMIVTEWYTPQEIKSQFGRDIFIDDPIEAVSLYLEMVQRELKRDWALKSLKEMGILAPVGKDVITKPTFGRISSEASRRLMKIRQMIKKVENGEPLDRADVARLRAYQAGQEKLRTLGNLREVSPGVFRSEDGVVEIRQSSRGDWLAYVNGQPIPRPVKPSQPTLGAAVEPPKVVIEPTVKPEAPDVEATWDPKRFGYYDKDGNRISTLTYRSAQQAGIPGLATGGPEEAVYWALPELRPWLTNPTEENIEYVHKLLRARLHAHSVEPSLTTDAYESYVENLIRLEDGWPWLKNMDYGDVAPPFVRPKPKPYTPRIPKYIIQDGRLTDNPEYLESIARAEADREARREIRSGTYIPKTVDDIRYVKQTSGPRESVYKATLPDGGEVTITKRKDPDNPGLSARWYIEINGNVVGAEAKFEDAKKAVADRLRRQATQPAPGAAAGGATRPVADISGVPALRTREEFFADLEDVELSWSRVGRNHVAYYDDFEIIITTAPKDSQSKYVIRVIAPDGKSVSDTSHVNLANTKDLVKKFYLSPEMERFSFRSRERAIREAIGDNADWPGLSIVDDSFQEYSSSTRVTAVDFGDETSLEIGWNGQEWYAKRLIGGRNFEGGIVASGSDWAEIVEEIDDLYPGIGRLLDEQLPGLPVGQARGAVTFVTADDLVGAGARTAAGAGLPQGVSVPGGWIARRDADEVPRRWLDQFAEFDREASPRLTPEEFAELRQSIVERGFDEPLVLEVGMDGYAVLIEGNHRLAIARDLDLENVPVRVIVAREVGEVNASTGRPNVWVNIDEDIAPGQLLKPGEALTDGNIAPVPIGMAPNLERIGTNVRGVAPEPGRTAAAGAGADDVARGEETLRAALAERMEYSFTPIIAESPDLGLRYRISPRVKNGGTPGDTIWVWEVDAVRMDGHPAAWFEVGRDFPSREAAVEGLISHYRAQPRTSQRAASRAGAAANEVLETGSARSISAPTIIRSADPPKIGNLRQTFDRVVRDPDAPPRQFSPFSPYEQPRRTQWDYEGHKYIIERLERSAIRPQPGAAGRVQYDTYRIYVVRPGEPRRTLTEGVSYDEAINATLRDANEVFKQVNPEQAGRALNIPPPEKVGIRRISAGSYEYTIPDGTIFRIVRVRRQVTAGKEIWAVQDTDGNVIGRFRTKDDAQSALEGKPVRPILEHPEGESMSRIARDAIKTIAEAEEKVRKITFAAASGKGATPGELDQLGLDIDNAINALRNALEILSFDDPDTARRIVNEINGRPDVQQVLSEKIEGVAARRPEPAARAGIQGTMDDGLEVMPEMGFSDRHVAEFYANMVANKQRSPMAQLVTDQIWETNRQELLEKLQTEAGWLEAAFDFGFWARMPEEAIDDWVNRVGLLLRRVADESGTPVIDPTQEVFDSTRYVEALREAGFADLTRGEGVRMNQTVVNIMNSERLYGPELLRDSIRRSFRAAKDVDGAEAFFRDFWRPYYTASKAWMTQGRGYGYTVRNIIGSMYNSWLLDVTVRHFREAGALLAARVKAKEEADQLIVRVGMTAEESIGEIWEKAFYESLEKNLKEGTMSVSDRSAKRIVTAYRSFQENNYGGRSARSRTQGEILDRGSYDMPVYGISELGRTPADLFPGRTVEELEWWQRGLNRTVDNAWMRHVTRLNEGVEDYLRFAAFLRGVDMYGIEDGGLAAGTIVRGTQFDYADLSDFERDVLKNIIPFYTWTRYNVPLQIRSVWMEPGKVARLLRFHEEVVQAWTGEAEDQEQSLPEWLRRRGGWMTDLTTPSASPDSILGRLFGQKEDPIAAFIESPLSDLGMLFNATINPLQMMNSDEIINNLNPLVGRLPYELFTGQSYSSGRELRPDAEAPRWAIALGLARRDDEGVWRYNERYGQTLRNLLPPLAQGERLFAPIMGDPRQRRRWLTSVGSNLLANPMYTVDPNQQSFAISQYAQGINDALADGIIDYEDKKEVITRLLDRGFSPAEIGTLGLGTPEEIAAEEYNFVELDRARQRQETEDEMMRFLEGMPAGVADQFIYSRGFRGLRGYEAVQAWRDRQAVDVLGALDLPPVDVAFSRWFSMLDTGEKQRHVFRYGFGPYRGAEAVQRWMMEGGLPNKPPGMGSADFVGGP